MIKMIVVDLDGTLLDKNRKVSNNTKEYLKKLKNNGYIVTIATGRIYTSALYATDGADFANYIISDTGTCAYNVSNSDPILKNFIDKEIAKKILNYYDENYCYIDICDKNTIYKYSNKIQKNCDHYIKTIKDKNYILNNCNDISHITISMKDNEDVMNLYNELMKDFCQLNIIIMQDSFSNRKWIEIMPKGCSKYNTIKDLACYLNISNEEIIAFGDGLNDIEMLKKCGIGIALKNALPEVKEVANDITIYDHNNDGVINYLKDYLNNN